MPEVPVRTYTDGQLASTSTVEANLDLSDTPTMLDDALTINVGDGGDFASLNEALDWLSRRRPSYRNSGSLATVNLVSGFEMSEFVIADGLDLGWVKITSDDATVPIDRSALDATDPVAFMAENGGTLPVIGTVFDLDSSGSQTAARVFRARATSTLIFLEGAGATGAAERLVEVAHASRMMAQGATFSGGAGIGVRVSNGSHAQLAEATISGNQDVNVAVGGSTVNLQDADVSGSVTSSGLRVSPGPCVVQAPRLDATGCAVHGINVQYGGMVTAYSATLSGCGVDAVYADGPAQIDVRDADLSSAGRYAAHATGGGTIHAVGATTTGAGTAATNVASGGTVIT